MKYVVIYKDVNYKVLYVGETKDYKKHLEWVKGLDSEFRSNFWVDAFCRVEVLKVKTKYDAKMLKAYLKKINGLQRFTYEKKYNGFKPCYEVVINKSLNQTENELRKRHDIYLSKLEKHKKYFDEKMSNFNL